MDYTCRTKTLQALNKSMIKNTILLSHKLQRPEGQWNNKQKTDLIDSLLRKYPVNPTYAIKEDSNVLSVIDGIQRLSTIRDFLADKFALSKDMEPVFVNGVEKNLAGLKYSKLDEETQDAILSSELQVYELMNCTEKDVREMFRRQNAGKPLNSRLLRVAYEDDEFTTKIYKLLEHPFMEKIVTKTQHKNGSDRATIIQAVMLCCSNNEQCYTSFRAKDMDAFVKEHGKESLPVLDALSIVLDKFDDAFETIKIPVTSIPMMLYAGYRVFKNKGSFTKLTDVINNFVNSYDSNEEYKLFLQSATTSSESVAPRLEYWKDLIKDL